MTSCPRCGRIADDEFVCADCGMSLALARRARPQPSPGLIDALGFAEEDDAAPRAQRDVRMWRLAAVICVGCLVAAVIAIVVLRSGGGSAKSHSGALPGPATSGSSPGAVGPLSSNLASPSLRTSTAEATPTPTKSSPSPSRTRSGARSSSSSTTPESSPVAATRSVRAAKGALDNGCGPHCYRLVVTLSAFPVGPHKVACWSEHGGLFGSYTTSATTSDACAFRRPHDSVWAVVDDRYRSNAVLW